jgi:hypothetical protein
MALAAIDKLTEAAGDGDPAQVTEFASVLKPLPAARLPPPGLSEAIARASSS